MFDLQGHRGARGLWPENTLGGFARVLELGVAGIELDCALTADGVVVVTHDPELSPEFTRDALGVFLPLRGPAVQALSYAQLQRYDVGRLRPQSEYARRFSAQEPLDGERIPRLTDVLSLVRTRARGAVRVSIEIKTFPEEPERTAAPEPFVAKVGEAIAAAGAQALVRILAFDWRVLRAAQRLLSGVPLVALTEQQPGEDTVRLTSAVPSPWLAGLNAGTFGGSVPRLVAASGAHGWGPDYLDLDAAQVAEAHALGLTVVPWTVNERSDMERMLACGVDGMISDRPDRLRTLLTERRLEVPRGWAA